MRSEFRGVKEEAAADHFTHNIDCDMLDSIQFAGIDFIIATCSTLSSLLEIDFIV